MVILSKPDASKQLFIGLFQSANDPISLISDGIGHVVTNSQRLHGDAKKLVDTEATPSSRFLLAVAKEELGKAYILLDMVRLDFSKHVPALKHLCDGFYQHATKIAYVNANLEYSLTDLTEARESFLYDRGPWVKGDYESGEPDMPNLWVVEREWSLYVDFFVPDRAWFNPIEWGRESSHAVGSDHDVVRVGEYVEIFSRVLMRGSFAVETLRDYNRIFSKVYCSHAKANDELNEIYSAFVKARPEAVETISCYPFLPESDPLFGWPLYHF